MRESLEKGQTRLIFQKFHDSKIEDIAVRLARLSVGLKYLLFLGTDLIIRPGYLANFSLLCFEL